MRFITPRKKPNILETAVMEPFITKGNVLVKDTSNALRIFSDIERKEERKIRKEMMKKKY